MEQPHAYLLCKNLECTPPFGPKEDCEMYGEHGECLGQVHIQISRKRTCNGCKALYFDHAAPECRLCYSIDLNLIKPLEPCPKPKTNVEFVHCRPKPKR